MDLKNPIPNHIAVDFDANVKITGINPYVDVPDPIIESLGGSDRIPVLLKIFNPSPDTTDDVLVNVRERLKAIGRLAEGNWSRTTLVPMRSEPTRLFLDRWMRESSGIGVGDVVSLCLKPDISPRELAIPPALSDALAENERAAQAWLALSPSRRKEILTYLNFLKTPEALAKNIAKTIRQLLEG